MRSELLQLGVEVSAIAVIIGGFMLLALGRSSGLGHSFRTSIRPMLEMVRQRSTMSRSELADATILAASALAAMGAVFDRQLFAALLALLLWFSRPWVVRLTKDENPVLAKISSFPIDLFIGVYVPIVIAQLLLLNWFLAASLLLVIIALSWPEGGGAIPGRRWRLAPVQ